MPSDAQPPATPVGLSYQVLVPHGANLPPIHAHMLSHTAVSLLIDDGANPKAIQTFVGHSSITMTLGTYGHLMDYGGGALVESMERRREAHRNGDSSPTPKGRG
jgi:integrase